MILHALNNHYERLRENPDVNIPLTGFGSQRFSFALLLSVEGELIQPLDLRITEGKKTYPRSLIVPQELEERSGAKISPHFCWDNTMYVLGNDNKGKPKRSRDAFEAFRAFHHQLCDGVNETAIIALLSFLDHWNPEDAPSLEYWEDMAGMNLAFQLEGEKRFIHQHPVVEKIWRDHLNAGREAVVGDCLVTNRRAPIARLHPAIKGVRGAQTKGAAIVSFNLDAFTSYRKDQSFNAPVSQDAAFAYTTALNHLLRSDSRQKVRIADATTVFWTERASAMEGFMGAIIEGSDDPGDIQKIRNYLKTVAQGKPPSDLEEDPDMAFYILGLAPNASRLSVRFWMASTVSDISRKILQHFEDLAIVKRYDTDQESPSLWRLLLETAVQRKSENIPPLLAGALMRSILSGSPYPQSLLSAIIMRIRADGNVNYYRAAIIKACLIRRFRNNPNQTMEVGMTLNTETTNTAYRLGRLFAVLENAQRTAVPGAGATIKDRYYGAASATPRTVFPQLMRLSQHHIQKIKQKNDGKDWGIEKRIGEVLQGIDTFPAHLKIEDQGLFALGYYHQRAAQFTKTEKPDTTDDAKKED
jgi:CRISPR-associated protein Csd1